MFDWLVQQNAGTLTILSIKIGCESFSNCFTQVGTTFTSATLECENVRKHPLGWKMAERCCEAEVELPASLLENWWDCRPQCPWASAYPGIGTFFLGPSLRTASRESHDLWKFGALRAPCEKIGQPQTTYYTSRLLFAICDWENMIYFIYSLEVFHGSSLKILLYQKRKGLSSNKHFSVASC